MSAPSPWVLAGHVVPLHRDDPALTFPGRVYIDDGTVVAARPASAEPPSGFADAPIVDSGDAFVYPGLIDLHSHIGYNALPLWTQPDEQRPFLHHDIWPSRSTYQEKVSWPAWVYAAGAPESLMTYVQVRALAGGTTTIQGWPTRNRRPANQLVRNADDQSFDGRPDPILTSTLVLSKADLAGRAEGLRRGKGFIYHCSEGQEGSIVTREFDDLRDTNCLRQRLIAIHLTALGDTAFKQWADQARIEGDDGPGAVVWSPFSNLWLYGQTTDVPAARDHGLALCLGTDWGPSGTKNLLGELKVARLVCDDADWPISDFELAQMVTANPGDTLSRLWGRTVGRLHSDSLADLVVLARRSDDAWDNLVRAREQDVRLVVVDGAAVYGTKALMDAAGQTRTTSVAVGRARRRVALTNPADEDLAPERRRQWYFCRALRALEAVRDDPVGAVESPLAGVPATPALGDEPLGNWLVLELDMPGGPGMVAGPPPPGVVVDFEPLPSMSHDRSWLRSVKGRGFHGGLLDGLADYFG